MKRPLLRFGKATLFAALLAILPTHAEAQGAVTCGNTAGESAAEIALGQMIYLSPPTNLTKVRTGKNELTLSWQGTLPPSIFPKNYRFTIFKAKDDGPWLKIGATTAKTFKDTDASMDHDARYVVNVRDGTGSPPDNFEAESSWPSNEVVERWGKVNLWAGGTAYGVEPVDHFPTGYLTVSDFFPDTAGANGTQTFTIGGPFTRVYTLDPVNASSWYMDAPMQSGWQRRGEPLSVSSHMQEDSGDVYRGVFTYVVPVYVSLEREMRLSPFSPPGSPSQDGDVRKYDLNASYSFYDLKKITGDVTRGFDGVSNPISQHITLTDPTTPDGYRDLQFEFTPSASNPDYISSFSMGSGTDGQLDAAPSIVENTGVKTVRYKNSGAAIERDSWLPLPVSRNSLVFNFHKPRTITVGVYYVDMWHYKAMSGGNILVTPNLARTRLQQTMEDNIKKIYGPQTSVSFEIETVGTEPHLKWYYGPGPFPAGITSDDSYKADGILDVVHENQKMQSLANTDPYDYSIFIFPANGKRLGHQPSANPNQTPDTGLTGVVPQTPSNHCFILDNVGDDTTAHELGHCLGLKHAFFPNWIHGMGTIPDDSRQRLMGYDRDKTKLRLIKGERDFVKAKAKELRGGQ